MADNLGNNPFVPAKTDILVHARELVLNIANEEHNVFEKVEPIELKDVFVVWFSKSLQNWKALVATSKPDGLYYEVTYNGDKGETYVDIYQKLRQVVVTDPKGV